MRLWFSLLFVTGTLVAANLKNEMIPMRDGVRLAVTVSLPLGTGPFPAILTRTPGTFSVALDTFVEAGYAVVQQNLRGIRESEGKWQSFTTEVNDGYDTVEWMAAQSWCNGRVAIYGAGGSGIAGYLTLASGAPHLSAGAIQDAEASPYLTLAYPGGVHQSGLVDAWTKLRGMESAPAFPRPLIHKMDSEYLQQEIRVHPEKVKVPILHYTGWFDVFTEGVIEYFTAAQSKGSEKALGNQKLFIHPKGHNGRLLGELQWEAETPSFSMLARRWFDYWLRDVDSGIHRLPAVQFYSLGDAKTKTPPGNAWRSVSGWPPNFTEASFYLQPGGGLSRTEPQQASSSSSYDYDPKDPAPSLMARAEDWLNRPPLDQRPLRGRGDILRFTTLPLTTAVDIAGPLRAELFVSTTARDTDFFVRLIDIYPDGFEALMNSQPLRLRFREGFDRMVPARKNKVYKINVNLWSLAVAIPAGHRIGVQITSSDVPRFDRHTNTWEPVKSYKEAVKATNTVHHSAAFPSRVVLPVLRSARPN